jgi:hypothetical protein
MSNKKKMSSHRKKMSSKSKRALELCLSARKKKANEQLKKK